MGGKQRQVSAALVKPSLGEKTSHDAKTLLLVN